MEPDETTGFCIFQLIKPSRPEEGSRRNGSFKNLLKIWENKRQIPKDFQRSSILLEIHANDTDGGNLPKVVTEEVTSPSMGPESFTIFDFSY